MGVLFLFVDGVGLGQPVKENPFYRYSLPSFERISGGGFFASEDREREEKEAVFHGVDANLDVEGLPQSGTGQTALFTGENAAKKIGKHFGPYPHTGIEPLLREESLFLKLKKRGGTPHFINGYPDIFFQKSRKKNRWSCTTMMCRSAGVKLNGKEEVLQGEAVTAGLTQRAWREKLEIDVPVIEPEQAAGRLLRKMNTCDLLLHEYYLTDKAGHSRDEEKAERVLRQYDRFLGHLLKNLEKKHTLVMSSDHGNLEDLSVKTHTRNRVPLFARGPGAGAFRDADSILDVTPAILKVLER